MSRIGKAPISIPQGVTVSVEKDNTVKVKGPKGELTKAIDPDMKVEVKEGEVIVERPTEQKRHKAMHGLYRSLINGMVVGVSEGYKIQQVFNGVGYKAEAKGQVLEMSVGFSHDIHFQFPSEVKVSAVTERRAAPIVTLESSDKQLLGQVAAKLRTIRPPEPYKGKGIKFVGEEIRRKAGKSAGK